ncbi:hypothetical protein GGD66_007936 [Bradyrhizobium sp. CIR48]|nr:hypothetical protein [Bradyrhizobium sp. CIR18]MBB4429334.1 hypothetical protein [Bradyrhizobium sp. CIR48]
MRVLTAAFDHSGNSTVDAVSLMEWTLLMTVHQMGL